MKIREDETSSGSAQVYSNLKAPAFHYRLETLGGRRPVAPVNIRIKPINHCNHDCRYCAYRVGNLQLGNEIDLKDAIPSDKMMETSGDIVSMGVRAVTFTEADTLGSIKDRSFKEFRLSDECREKAFAINPSIHRPHNCAGHRKNLSVTDFIATDKDHLMFV
jgi:hypothetical protein